MWFVVMVLVWAIDGFCVGVVAVTGDGVGTGYRWILCRGCGCGSRIVVGYVSIPWSFWWWLGLNL